MPDTYVIEESDYPVVFSDSPDSPAAEFLVEERPRSIGTSTASESSTPPSRRKI